jgi:hypothetical protein
MNRRGGSLLFVLITLVFIGGVTGILFSIARLRWLGGATALRSARTQVAASAESERVLAAWDPVRADSLAIGRSIILPGLLGPDGLSSQDSLQRLGTDLYLLRVLAEQRTRDGVLLARGGMARLVELAIADASDSQAIAAVGPVILDGSPVIDGTDRLPPGWGGACPSGAPVGAPAVRSSLVAPVEGNCSGGNCLIGSPPTLLDSTVRPGFLDQLGPVSFTDLTDLADLEITGTVAGIGTGVSVAPCGQDLPGNWGDPSGLTGACSSYFPLILARDGTRIEGVAAQGVLLGLGRLELAGDLAFHGVVLSRGSVTLRDRARVIGTLQAEDTVKVLDLARLERSTCAVRRALVGAGRPRRRVERGWIRWP